MFYQYAPGQVGVTADHDVLYLVQPGDEGLEAIRPWLQRGLRTADRPRFPPHRHRRPDHHDRKAYQIGPMQDISGSGRHLVHIQMNHVSVQKINIGRETQSIKSMLTRFQSWGRDNHIWVIIVAHPRSLKKIDGKNEMEDINMYTISGQRQLGEPGRFHPFHHSHKRTRPRLHPSGCIESARSGTMPHGNRVLHPPTLRTLRRARERGGMRWLVISVVSEAARLVLHVSKHRLMHRQV